MTNRSKISTSKQKTLLIVLFSIVTLLIVLIVGLVYRLNNQANSKVISETPVYEKIQTELSKTQEITGIDLAQETENLKNISLDSILKNQQESNQNEQILQSLETRLQENYKPVTDMGVSVYGGKVVDLVEFIPNFYELNKQYLRNELADKSRLYTIPVNEAEIVLNPITTQSTLFAPQYYTFLEKEGAVLYLGMNISTLYDFKVGEEVYWLSGFESDTGFSFYHLSKPYLRGLLQLNGLVFDQETNKIDENTVRFKVHIEEPSQDDGHTDIEYDLKIADILNSKILSDYSSLLRRIN